MTKLDPATTFVRSLDGNFYMVREAADMLGVNHRTLRNLNEGDDKDLKPSFMAYLGKVRIYLYTEEDLKRLEKYFQERKQVFPNTEKSGTSNGRPARYSKEERKQRQRLFSKAHYYGRRAQEETEKGDLAKASEYLEKQREVKEGLTNWTASQSVSRTRRPSTGTGRGSSSSTAPTFQKASTETNM